MSKVKTLSKVQKASQDAIKAIIAQGNIALGTQGTSLWRLNAEFKYKLLCAVRISSAGNYSAVPVMDGITDANGEQVLPFHLYAGINYDTLETYEEGDTIICHTVQRVPNELATKQDLDRIDEWAKLRNEKDGRVMTTLATQGHRDAITNKTVTYAITKIVDA